MLPLKQSGEKYFFAPGGVVITPLHSFWLWACRQYSVCHWNCRFVGYMTRNVFGYGSGQIWLDDVLCSGSESSVSECRHSGWGVHNCSHTQDVAISCQSMPTTSPPTTSTFRCRNH